MSDRISPATRSALNRQLRCGVVVVCVFCVPRGSDSLACRVQFHMNQGWFVLADCKTFVVGVSSRFPSAESIPGRSAKYTITAFSRIKPATTTHNKRCALRASRTLFVSNVIASKRSCANTNSRSLNTWDFSRLNQHCQFLFIQCDALAPITFGKRAATAAALLSRNRDRPFGLGSQCNVKFRCCTARGFDDTHFLSNT